MAIFSYIFGLIIACASYAVYQIYYDTYPSIVKKPDKRYDYVIVGAGTTGCVLAARLSEDLTTRVLLVEAGDLMGYFTKIPLTPTAAQQGPYDWSVRTKPQKYSSFGMWDQTQIIPRGKGLGGSGQINFLLHSFGLPEDYERWQRPGFSSWTLGNLKPYFVKAFGTEDSEFDSNYCSEIGKCLYSKAPMKLKQIDHQDELMKTFKEASTTSTSAKGKVIFRKPTATIKDGIRHSTCDAYLKPALRRKNLHVVLRTHAVSIRFENKTASSLYILQNHRELNNIFVNKEIIVCAGAIKTPQLLMLSGIGPVDVIKRLGVKLISKNNDVGRNLHDHMNMPFFVSIKKPISITLSKVFTFGTVWDYFWNKKGILSFPPVAGIEYQGSSALILFSMGTASERLLRDLSNYIPQVFRDTFPFHNQTSKEGFMFLATCLQPRSRGSVKVTKASISVPVSVDPNYLHQGWDAKCMIGAMRRAEKLIKSKPFQEIGAKIHWPRPERCMSLWRYSKYEQMGIVSKKRKHRQIKFNQDSPPEAFLECILREVAVTGHHASGTCAGGAVVDDDLRVKAVSGVRVVDASVMPTPVSLFPNSVLVGIAERAADIIKRSAS